MYIVEYEYKYQLKMTSSDIFSVHDIISSNNDWRKQVMIITLLCYTLLHSRYKYVHIIAISALQSLS